MDALDEAYNVLEVSDSLIAQLKKDSKTSFFFKLFLFVIDDDEYNWNCLFDCNIYIYMLPIFKHIYLCTFGTLLHRRKSSKVECRSKIPPISPPPIFSKLRYQKSGFTITVVCNKDPKNTKKLNLPNEPRSRPLNFNFSNY